MTTEAVVDSIEQASRALISYPKQAEFGRPIPKNKVYEKAGVNTRLKNLFVEQVDQIVWRYKLAPETINLPERPDVPEIQIFAIALKTSELHLDVLRCIDDAVQYPVIYELTQETGAETVTKVIAAYKRPSESGANRWVLSSYFSTGWLPATCERTSMPVALHLGGLYEQLLYRLTPLRPRPQESLPELVTRIEQVRAKQRELDKASSRLAKEKQFNRKVGINAQLRKLKNELETLKKRSET